MDNNSIETNKASKDSKTDLQKQINEIQTNCDKYSNKYGAYGSGGYE